MAVQALVTGEIKAAVVGGVSLFESEETHKLFEQRGILSKAQSFHVFDERADGVVLGEGVGMVLLKTVSQAIEDGDSIYAVVKAASVNNDGRTAGTATPSLEAQKSVMKTALEKSGKQPEDITHIEANGSGTVVTDLLELKAIQSVYRSKDAGARNRICETEHRAPALRRRNCKFHKSCSHAERKELYPVFIRRA